MWNCNIFVCCAGITDYLTTEISTSKQKKFSLVTFVDTPGLVDGDMKYPFDVNRAILWLGEAKLNICIVQLIMSPSFFQCSDAVGWMTTIERHLACNKTTAAVSIGSSLGTYTNA